MRGVMTLTMTVVLFVNAQATIERLVDGPRIVIGAEDRGRDGDFA